METTSSALALAERRGEKTEFSRGDSIIMQWDMSITTPRRGIAGRANRTTNGTACQNDLGWASNELLLQRPRQAGSGIPFFGGRISARLRHALYSKSEVLDCRGTFARHILRRESLSSKLWGSACKAATALCPRAMCEHKELRRALRLPALWRFGT